MTDVNGRLVLYYMKVLYLFEHTPILVQLVVTLTNVCGEKNMLLKQIIKPFWAFLNAQTATDLK